MLIIVFLNSTYQPLIHIKILFIFLFKQQKNIFITITYLPVQHKNTFITVTLSTCTTCRPQSGFYLVQSNHALEK